MMRWIGSFVVLGVIWAVALAWCWLAIQRESYSLFISWLVFCPFASFCVGLAARRMPGLAWLGLGSIGVALVVFISYWQPWPWNECADGEYGFGCEIEKFFFFWMAGLYALGLAAAIGVGVVVSRALHRQPATAD